jgi:hypothetical protein
MIKGKTITLNFFKKEIKMQVKNIDYAKIDGLSRKDRTKIPDGLFKYIKKHINRLLTLVGMYFIVHLFASNGAIVKPIGDFLKSLTGVL